MAAARSEVRSSPMADVVELVEREAVAARDALPGVAPAAVAVALAPALALLDGIEREVRSWTLPNGLEVSERRIPVGVVGANFEARPNVAVDVASQVLKSRNAALLRTGGAALRTVT